MAALLWLTETDRRALAVTIHVLYQTSAAEDARDRRIRRAKT
jgi:hypothetical protein